jgi:hypothetical protein
MSRNAQEEGRTDSAPAESCPLTLPASGRLPGVLAIAALPAAIFIKPLFFSLAGALLAVVSLLLAPAGCRCLGAMGLLGAATVGTLLLLGRF